MSGSGSGSEVSPIPKRSCRRRSGFGAHQFHHTLDYVTVYDNYSHGGFAKGSQGTKFGD